MKVIIAAVILAILGVALSIDIPNIVDLVDRHWVFGGRFDSVTQPDGTEESASNLALWNGTYFHTFGSGANGVVRTVMMDDCRNLYIAGDFTTVGGVSTGPIAVLKFGESSFSKIGDYSSGVSPSVRALTVDCFKKPSISNKQCVCDVYAAGQFTFSYGNDQTAVNIAKYSGDTGAWDNLGGATAHKIATIGRVVYKKTLVGSASNIVHVAGDGFYKQYLTDTKAWEDILVDVSADFNGLYYDPEIFSTDQMFFAGEFEIDIGSGKTCENVCEYNRKDKKWSAVGTTNVPTSEIKAIAGNGDDVFVAGNFNNAPLSYVAKLKDGSSTWNNVHSSDSTVATGEMNVIKVCTSTSFKCSSGSVSLGGDAGFAAFYDESKSEWKKFGTTYTPFSQTLSTAAVYGVETYSTIGSASTLSMSFACLIAVAFAVLASIL